MPMCHRSLYSSQIDLGILLDFVAFTEAITPGEREKFLSMANLVKFPLLRMLKLWRNDFGLIKPKD